MPDPDLLPLNESAVPSKTGLRTGFCEGSKDDMLVEMGFREGSKDGMLVGVCSGLECMEGIVVGCCAALTIGQTHSFVGEHSLPSAALNIKNSSEKFEDLEHPDGKLKFS